MVSLFGIKNRPLESSNESTATSVSSNFRLVPSGYLTVSDETKKSLEQMNITVFTAAPS